MRKSKQPNRRVKSLTVTGGVPEQRHDIDPAAKYEEGTKLLDRLKSSP
jgi:hypothetical protein